ncbi:hypothetical protein CLOSTASPAR_02997 [[Clostridium] asparagiforme DSM 15981]|uniref:Uncharacterized protein n=1 Tax=[Clostridium] asparagiforme DSM 15981 TaxID=518636 RepID=C0D160_9FIRM|nr:hypothetical protein CLOSTASPAR_02997 [[Clostridium] asparagiforme DSM 15981]
MTYRPRREKSIRPCIDRSRWTFLSLKHVIIISEAYPYACAFWGE